MATATSVDERLVPISTDQLEIGESEFEILLLNPLTGELILYCRPGERITQDALDRLRARRIRSVAMRQSEYERYCQARMESQAADFSDRISMLATIHKHSFEQQLLNGTPVQVIEEAGNVADHVVRDIASFSGPFDELFGLLAHDDSTYTHCVNVSVYSVMLARRLAIRRPEDLRDVALGGLLHDIGKRHIQKRILNKPGSLSDKERETIKQHPLLGFRELARHKELSWSALMMIYQHHERPDGSGYPVGIGGEEINLFAELCSVADIFHALTSLRPYRRPLSLADACTHLKKLVAEGAVSGDMVRCWTSVLGE